MERQKTAAAILSYNHPGITGKCIQSALNFFQSENIYLIHNGSERTNIAALKKSFPQIKHFEISANVGFAGGSNFAINKAFEENFSHVLFLSNDTQLQEWNPPSLTDGLFAPKILLRETGGVHSLGGRVCLRRGKLEHLTEDVEKVDKSFYVPGSAFVVGRGAWQKLKGFDENLGSYWEDVDLSLRASKAGIKLGRLEGVTLRHGVAKTCGGNPYYTLYLYQRNRRRVVLRHAPFIFKPLFLSSYYGWASLKLAKLLKQQSFYKAKLLLKATVS